MLLSILASVAIVTNAHKLSAPPMGVVWCGVVGCGVV